tara:strand:- start:22072 stop:22476 length:405 start_codon:yes stop_codon:yes gene_type:complete
MNSKIIVSEGTNLILVNGEEILNRNWIATRDDDGIKAQIYNNDDLIEFNVRDRDIMNEGKKMINKTKMIPLMERLKKELKKSRRRVNLLEPLKRRGTRKRDLKIEKRTPTPYPNKPNKKEKKRKLKKKKSKSNK